jgi:non-heme Fe2+,alpha-ketoglutarate-dependent halogenase
MGRLPESAIAHNREHGCYAPIRVMSEGEAADIRRKREAHEASHGVLKRSMRHKSHLLFTWLDGRPLEDGGCDFLKS